MTIPASRWISLAATHAAAASCGAAIAYYAVTGKPDDESSHRHDGDLSKQPEQQPPSPPLISAAAPMMPVTIFRPHQDMEIAFDARTRNPMYALQRLPPAHERMNNGNSNSSISGKTRQGHNFHEEKSLAPSHRSRNSYYKHSGYDRGHLIPASDFRGDPDAVSATFNLINICPQNPQVNRRVWGRLEALIRTIAQEDTRNITYVCSGPMWLPSGIVTKENATSAGSNDKVLSKPLFQFSHIGIGQPPSLVHVPTHFFKVVAIVREDGNLDRIAAFVVPNQDLTDGKTIDLSQYIVRIKDLEAVTGMAFFLKYLGPKHDDELAESANRSTMDLRETADILAEDIMQEGNYQKRVQSASYTDLAAIPTNKKSKKKMRSLQKAGQIRHLCDDKRCSVIVRGARTKDNTQEKL